MKKCLLSDASTRINHEMSKKKLHSNLGTHFDHARFSHTIVVAPSLSSSKFPPTVTVVTPSICYRKS
jgi:hypothetical protein